MQLERRDQYLTPFQWSEVLAILAFTAYFAFTNHGHTWWYVTIDALAAVCGVFCVVLCAAGKRSQYYWGMVNILAYVVISFLNRYYGEVMLNALYYLPTQFIGWYIWGKHYNEQDNHVEAKRMTALHAALMLFICVVGIFAYKWLLDLLKGQATLLDSTSTVLSIFANALMVLRYREQWALWIIVDVVTVVMWAVAGDFLMTAMWAIYLCNAIYGLVMWSTALKKTT